MYVEGGVKGLLLSTDAEKAFDRVSWDYLRGMLSHVGFKSNMLAWTQSLYSFPKAQVKVNGILSEPFELKNGTRQGSPIFPLLCILSLEPLIRTVKAHPHIQGIHAKKYQVAAFANDLLFYLTKPSSSLLHVMQIFQVYGHFSNFKINYSKSHVLNISVKQFQQSHLNEIGTGRDHPGF